MDVHYLQGYRAREQGLGRRVCPYANGTEARAAWLAGYEARKLQDYNRMYDVRPNTKGDA